MNSKPYKISRIKLKPYENMSIYDVFLFKILSDMSDRIYLYVDDRSQDISTIRTVQKKIDDTLNILKRFDVKPPDTIIRYTDYYDTAWVYLHKLVQFKYTLLNYNVNQQDDDLDTFMRNNKIKIFLLPPKTNEPMNKYDFILYDSGWFRDILIEVIIDDAENVNYILDERTKDPSHNDMSRINRIVSDNLTDVLKFNRPVVVLTNIIENIEKLNKKLNMIPTINDLTFDQLFGRFGMI